jgi:hypothetical protein
MAGLDPIRANISCALVIARRFSAVAIQPDPVFRSLAFFLGIASLRSQ